MRQRFSSRVGQIPDDIARLAYEQGLGTPQGGQSITILERGWSWLRRISLHGFLYSALLYGACILSLHFDSANMLLQNQIVLPLLLLFDLFCCLFLLIPILTQKRRTVFPCDNGFIIRRSTTKLHTLRWDEIAIIRQTAIRFIGDQLFHGCLYTIRSHDGHTLTFVAGNPRNIPAASRNSLAGNLAKAKNFSTILEKEFTRLCLPLQFADYQAGQTLIFGQISLNRQGVSVHGAMLTWEQVADLLLAKDRRLIIYRTGEQPVVWQKLPAYKIPNLILLLALFKRIRSGQSEQALEKSGELDCQREEPTIQP